MRQYLDLLQEIKDNGTRKGAARGGMPKTLSLFGYQFRHNLEEGFPLLTTKKINFKNIVVELLWFLRGDTNIKFLIDNGCNIWNEDAYNYYLKLCRRDSLNAMDFDKFEGLVKYPYSKKTSDYLSSIGMLPTNYTLGDCGEQYGKLWREWKCNPFVVTESNPNSWAGGRIFKELKWNSIDQIQELINGLKENPLSRRHIVTAWNPVTLDDMALNACHAFVQFNCRPITPRKRTEIAKQKGLELPEGINSSDFWDKECDKLNIPKYKLDCQMYQRSADVFLG